MAGGEGFLSRHLDRPLAEGDGQGQLLAVAIDAQGDLVAGDVGEEQVDERVVGVDALAIDRGDDIAALQARRDRMVPALREMAYEVTSPEGTFYVMVRSPDPDDLAFSGKLAEAGALVMPGTILETPGWFRISLTASDEMVENGIRIFRESRG